MNVFHPWSIQNEKCVKVKKHKKLVREAQLGNMGLFQNQI